MITYALYHQAFIKTSQNDIIIMFQPRQPTRFSAFWHFLHR